MKERNNFCQLATIMICLHSHSYICVEKNESKEKSSPCLWIFTTLVFSLSLNFSCCLLSLSLPSLMGIWFDFPYLFHHWWESGLTLESSCISSFSANEKCILKQNESKKVLRKSEEKWMSHFLSSHFFLQVCFTFIFGILSIPLSLCYKKFLFLSWCNLLVYESSSRSGFKESEERIKRERETEREMARKEKMGREKKGRRRCKITLCCHKKVKLKEKGAQMKNVWKRIE